MAGFVTPTHVLLLLAAIGAFVVLGRLSRTGPRAGASPRGRRAWTSARRWRLRKPTRTEAHVGWLVVSALVALAFTHALALPLFLLIFFALWLAGFGLLSRLYR
jgi:hypothetical protein